MLAITLPKQPTVIEKDGDRAIIEIAELAPGYGHTVGNALRRVLYSSLEGAAITSVKFAGVPHEFTALEGVLEDVLEITLNLKEVRVILHGDEPQTLKLNIKGKKEVTAKDIEAPSQVEIVNLGTHIATLTNAKSELSAELHVERGLGYVQVEEDEKEKKEIGVIKVEAAFAPIKLVNFTVEDMRVGDRTDFNRIRLEIITDGTISPEEAYVRAAQTFLEHAQVLARLEGYEKVEGVKPAQKAAAKKSAQKKTAAKKPSRSAVPKQAAKKTTKKK